MNEVVRNNISRPIALFIPGLNGGGAQKVVVNLANALIDLCDQPVHVVLARADGAFVSDLRPEVTVIDLGTKRASRSVRALARYLRNHQPAVLCSSLNYANVCATLSWKLARSSARLVLREANVVRVPAGGLRARFVANAKVRLMMLTYRESDAIVALGQVVAQTLVDVAKVPREKIVILHNPVDLAAIERNALIEVEIPGLPANARYICAVGRFSEQKGFDILLDAFAGLNRPDLHLVIVGEGPLRSALEARAADLGITDRVALPGFMANPQAVMARAELFVMSSRWEGLPNVLLEALAVGVPILVTDCPGEIGEVLGDGRFGHMVKHNDPAALQAGMAEALAHPRSTTDERKARAREFSAGAIARRYQDQVFFPNAD